MFFVSWRTGVIAEAVPILNLAVSAVDDQLTFLVHRNFSSEIDGLFFRRHGRCDPAVTLAPDRPTILVWDHMLVFSIVWPSFHSETEY